MKCQPLSVLAGLFLLLASRTLRSQESSDAVAPVRHEVAIESAGEGMQRVRWVEPLDWEREPERLRPLLVSLHSWSSDCDQIRPQLEQLAAERGWILIAPDFQGPNVRPTACGSEVAQRDILLAVRWACERFPIDRRRIYLTGVSGGGHMTMLMVGRYPKIWAGASAWVGISDLAQWHQEHVGKSRYAENLEAVCRGPYGASAAVDRDYQTRSPMAYLHHAAHVPLDIAAGIRDGHRGSVPIHHGIDAFHAVLRGQGIEPGDEPWVPRAVIDRLSASPDDLPEVLGRDDVWERDWFLRAESQETRLTIFEGGHEGIDAGAIEFLETRQLTNPIPLEWLDEPGSEPDFRWWTDRRAWEEGR